MLILLNILKAIAYILDVVITFYLVVLFARVILSWFRVPYNQIIHMIYQVTEPALRPIRNRIPLSVGIDFSPMILFLLLMVIRIVVVGSIFDYVESYRLQYIQSF
jgi:YggT family protein